MPKKKKASKKLKILVGVLVFYVVAAAASAVLAYRDYKAISHLNISANGDGIKQALAAAVRLKRETYLVRPIMLTRLSWRQKIDQLDKVADAAPLIMALAGIDGEKTYLVVFQNNTELRPSGGIWGSYGILKVSGGRIISLKTDDTYNIDPTNIGKFAPPEEVKDIFADEWRFWNANWSPDYKKSVEQGLYFYRQVDPSVQFDGVIGPNLDFVLNLIRSSGPIAVENHQITLDEKNFITKMVLEPMTPASTKELPDYVKNAEKNIVLADIGQDLINSLISSNKSRELATKTYSALEGQDLLLYFSDPALQTKSEKIGWAGRMPGGDNFAMAVDANLGSKLDFWVEKGLKVEGLGEGKYRATLSYKNTIGSDDANHVFKIYRDYLRLYVPKDTQLVSAEGGQTTPAMQTDSELGLNYVSTTVVLSPGEVGTVSIVWQIPRGLAGNKLKVIKQPGSHISIKQ